MQSTITYLKAPAEDLKLDLTLTASKSESNRVLIIKALCEQNFLIHNLATAKDTTTLDELLAELPEEMDVGPAGTTLRFLAAYLALTADKQYVLTGSERMLERPVGILVDALRSLGGRVRYMGNVGYPPLKISPGDMEGGEITIDGSVSSQFISALMLIAPKLKGGLTIRFEGEIASRPYLVMTATTMRHFGITVRWLDDGLLIPEGQYAPQDITIEADWSSASYWYSLMALSQGDKLHLRGLKEHSMQADQAAMDLFGKLGVSSMFSPNGVLLTKKIGMAHDFEADFEDCPDIAQTLAVACAGLEVPAKLKGLQSLRIKETDRIQALQNELEKLNVPTEVDGDTLLIGMTEGLPEEVIISTYEDHRMAMAFAPLAYKMKRIGFENPEVVEKSYPDFWEDLKKAGFEVETTS